MSTSTATHVIPERGRVTLAETVADSRVMAVRQLRKPCADRCTPSICSCSR